MKAEAIVIEQTVNAPVSKVWEAITDKDKMKQWYFDFDAFKPVVGFEFKFYGGTEENQYLHLCEITEVVVGVKLIYSWRYDGYSGKSFVMFELSGKGQTTSVTLTHTGLESFPADNPDFAKGNFVEGWNQIIKTSLKEYVEKA